MRALLLALAVPLACRVGAEEGWRPREGASLVGTRPPEWEGLHWIQGGPLRLADLRGSAVLVRFWLVGCDYCRRTAPALRTLDERYRARGLRVVAIHHPKSRETLDPALVGRAARALGFRFPVATDERWRTVRAWGVGTTFRHYTSVSFLLDRDGVIRFVHDGGEFHHGGGPGHSECNAAMDALVAAMEAVL